MPMAGPDMKLRYFHGPGPLRGLIMIRDSRRVELFIKQIDDESYALVALAGEAHRQPDRSKCQGIYPTAPQAEVALRGIADSLLEKDYSMARHHPIWSVQAQRLARRIRHGRCVGDFAAEEDQSEPIG